MGASGCHHRLPEALMQAQASPEFSAASETTAAFDGNKILQERVIPGCISQQASLSWMSDASCPQEWAR